MITPAGQAGMTSSAQHAEDDDPGWGERAYKAVYNCGYLRMIQSGWTMEEARAACRHFMKLDEPSELRAWGGVTAKMVRDKVLVPVGYAPAASSHGSPKRTYRLA